MNKIKKKKQEVQEKIYDEMITQLDDPDIEHLKGYDKEYGQLVQNMNDMAKTADTLDTKTKQGSITPSDILRCATYFGGIAAVLLFESKGNIIHSKSLGMLIKKIF